MHPAAQLCNARKFRLLKTPSHEMGCTPLTVTGFFHVSPCLSKLSFREQRTSCSACFFSARLVHMLASGDHKRPWRMPTQSLLVVCSMSLERAATGVCASNLKTTCWRFSCAFFTVWL